MPTVCICTETCVCTCTETDVIVTVSKTVVVAMGASGSVRVSCSCRVVVPALGTVSAMVSPCCATACATPIANNNLAERESVFILSVGRNGYPLAVRTIGLLVRQADFEVSASEVVSPSRGNARGFR